jgi:hypothetical protein
MGAVRWLGNYRNRVFALAAIALCAALLSFEFFTNYPAMVTRDRPLAVGDPEAVLEFIFMGAAVVLPAAAILFPSKASIAVAKVHAALWAACVIVEYITFEPGHSSPGYLLDVAFEIFFFGLLAIELVMIRIATARLPPADRALSRMPWLFTAIVVALVGGWGAGVMAWAETVPVRVVEAAEKAAGDRAYCLEIVGRPAQSRRDLTGRSMHAPDYSGWTFQFHALLVAGEGAERTYSNWSYRTGRFELVGEHARNGLHLDSDRHCVPAPHFARDLK